MSDFNSDISILNEAARCPDCSYSRAGLPRDAVCPECGRPHRPDELTLMGWGPTVHSRNGLWWTWGILLFLTMIVATPILIWGIPWQRALLISSGNIVLFVLIARSVWLRLSGSIEHGTIIVHLDPDRCEIKHRLAGIRRERAWRDDIPFSLDPRRASDWRSTIGRTWAWRQPQIRVDIELTSEQASALRRLRETWVAAASQADPLAGTIGTREWSVQRRV